MLEYLRIDTFNHFKPYSCRFFQFLFVYIPIKMFPWWIFACQWSKFAFPIFAKRLYHGFLELLPSTAYEKNGKSHVTPELCLPKFTPVKIKSCNSPSYSKNSFYWLTSWNIRWHFFGFKIKLVDFKLFPRRQNFHISRKFDHHLIMLNLSMKTNAWTTQFAWAMGIYSRNFRGLPIHGFAYAKVKKSIEF